MRPTKIIQRDLKPVQTFARGAASCSAQAKVYGACIVAQYENVEKDMCQREFQAFKLCVQQKLGKKW
ncbi:hypothetical protein IE53DRAFT_385170 [Violaceomyces palustris]|uniref:Uncharacterized protein n=1 Tax=Violaceomyces palustris TaxID=1673888 RepID=A0ACD0P2Z3_9BASI|nr:hypothetical protein IE53DRAFT_385170 [Violaceomyces palustris]